MMKALNELRVWCENNFLPLPKITLEWPAEKVIGANMALLSLLPFTVAPKPFRSMRIMGFAVDIVPTPPVANEDYLDLASG